jgi:hypothetical protein
MLNLGVAAMYRKTLKHVCGVKNVNNTINKPFNNLTIKFLNVLSRLIIENKENKSYPDLITFAFWIRNSKILFIKKKLDNLESKVSKGIIFHISPSNVPLNFAYSFVFGLLTGNSNILKLPNKNFPQVKIFCELINYLFNIKEFKQLENKNSFIKYDSKITEITKDYSLKADVRIIWGGDNTIKSVKRFDTSLKNIDIVFSDRTSIAVLDISENILKKNIDFDKLAQKFYNDTFLMDQNACSSPHILVWLGKKNNIIKFQKQFWNSLLILVKQKYDMPLIASIDKLDLACEDSVRYKKYISEIINYNNFITRVLLKNTPKDLSKLRGKFGYFYEINSINLENIIGKLNEKFQTLTYFNIEKNKIHNLLLNNQKYAIDRIVPIGSALEMDFLWDGYDLLNILTRQITIN